MLIFMLLPVTNSIAIALCGGSLDGNGVVPVIEVTACQAMLI